jgi:hypothetical protein
VSNTDLKEFGCKKGTLNISKLGVKVKSNTSKKLYIVVPTTYKSDGTFKILKLSRELMLNAIVMCVKALELSPSPPKTRCLV